MLAVARTHPLVLCILVNAERAAPHWESMLDSLDALSPLVDDAAVGHAYVDMRGIPGDPNAWIAQTRALLAPYALTIRMGVGANKFTAYAAARTRDGTICALGEERSFLAPLDLDLLPIDTHVRERLRMLGLATLGDLARLPHGPFVRRFGREAARWHACARGEDRTPFLPRAHAVAIEATVFGEGSVEAQAQLFFALRMLLSRVCADLDRCGKRAGALDLAFELDDGSERCIAVPIATPSADETTLGEILRTKVSDCTFPCAIVGLRLRALRLEEGGEAMPIFPADDVDPRRVAVTLARLETITGEAPRRARVKPAHALERRFNYESFSLCHPERSERVGASEAEEPLKSVFPQLRLLTVREIDVSVVRGVPACVDGRAVRSCEGPWRIEEGWFSESEVARDEYDTVLDDGRRVRVYRQGTRWYLRGAYD